MRKLKKIIILVLIISIFTSVLAYANISSDSNHIHRMLINQYTVYDQYTHNEHKFYYHHYKICQVENCFYQETIEERTGKESHSFYRYSDTHPI